MEWKTLTVDEVKKINMQFANNNDYTALHFLISNNIVDVINAAIKAGADVNKADKQGHTPLHHAAINAENPDIINILVKAGAYINAKDNNGKKAIDLAEYNKHHSNIIQQTIRANTKINSMDLAKELESTGYIDFEHNNIFYNFNTDINNTHSFKAENLLSGHKYSADVGIKDAREALEFTLNSGKYFELDKVPEQLQKKRDAVLKQYDKLKNIDSNKTKQTKSATQVLKEKGSNEQGLSR